MNEDLRARAIEAAEAAEAAWWATPPEEWWSAPEAQRGEASHAMADAVLGVVADWCDEQTTQQELDVWVPLHDGKDRELSLGRQIGWADAYWRVAGACRPVGEEA